MTDINHGPYQGVVEIARNGVDEVIRLRTLNAELVEALQTIMAGVAGCERDPKWEAARTALAKAGGQQ